MATEKFTRPAAVAGMFYSNTATQLRTDINDMLDQAKEISLEKQPLAIIAPHAGYVYSGPVAATAYRLIRHYADNIHRVILLGPSHRVPFHGLAMSSASQYETPLGTVSIDHDSYHKISEHSAVKVLDAAHAQEHSLEVHVPFLQVVLNRFSLVPLVVGDADGHTVAEVLELLDIDSHTLIVVSSDLSHYLDYQSARQRDQKTSDAIAHLQPENIQYEDACGRNPLNGLLMLSKKHGLHATMIDLRNSGDTAGPSDRVVGYGAYVIH